MNRSGITAAGLSRDSPWDTCSDATRDTAVTLRRLVFSYQRSALDKSVAAVRCSPEIRKRLAQHHRVEQRLVGPLREGGRHRVCGVAEQRKRALARPGYRMPKMRVRRIGQIVVGQRREYSIDRRRTIP